MQGIHGGSFHKRLAQLPFNAAVSWRAKQRTVVRPLSTSSVLTRSRCAGGEGRLFSSVFPAPPLWLRFWLHDRKSRRRVSCLPFEHLTRHGTPASPRTPGTSQSFRLLLLATMTTMSATTDEGGSRQLRRRKEGHHSVSATEVVVSVTGSNSKHQNNRKKSAKAAVGSSPTDDDVKPTSKSREESFSTDIEARLWNLDKTDQLTSLTVVELRGLMKHIGKPTAGRKEELIGEVKKWLTQRQASANHHSVLDSTRPTRESSSDADSLEGTLLKAESNKSRQTEAMSRLTDSYAGADLHETLVEKKPLRRDPQTMAEENDSLQNGSSIPARKLPQGATKRKKKPEKESDDEDFQPATVQVEEKKFRSSRRGTKVEKQMEESVEEVTVTATKTGQKRKVQVSKNSQSKKGKVIDVEEEEPHIGPPWTMLVHKKPQPDWIVYNPDKMRPDPPPSGTKTMKLMSWNVNGLRALMKDKDKKAEEGLLLINLANEEDFDVLCLQETKLQEKDVEQISKAFLSDYADRIWSCSTSKLGYSGTAVLSRVKPVSVKSGLGIPDHDSEGRLITVEFDTFFLITSYVPNSGEKLARLSYRTEEWDTALSRHVKDLEKQKPVILTGDLNCANEEIDIYNPDGNRKSAGFTKEERVSFKENFLNQGMVDTFRQQHPNAVAYTYWGYRSGARPKNQGWRLDYFLVSEALTEQVHDSYVRPDVLGSDHCPIGVILKL